MNQNFNNKNILMHKSSKMFNKYIYKSYLIINGNSYLQIFLIMGWKNKNV